MNSSTLSNDPASVVEVKMLRAFAKDHNACIVGHSDVGGRRHLQFKSKIPSGVRKKRDLRQALFMYVTLTKGRAEWGKKLSLGVKNASSVCVSRDIRDVTRPSNFGPSSCIWSIVS